MGWRCEFTFKNVPFPAVDTVQDYVLTIYEVWVRGEPMKLSGPPAYYTISLPNNVVNGDPLPVTFDIPDSVGLPANEKLTFLVKILSYDPDGTAFFEAMYSVGPYELGADIGTNQAIADWSTGDFTPPAGP